LLEIAKRFLEKTIVHGNYHVLQDLEDIESAVIIQAFQRGDAIESILKEHQRVKSK
jgi:hypothetical protein